MHDNELWQVFQENGLPISGRGAIDDAFDADQTLISDNSHVWFWRKTPDGISILLQKRALAKKKAPGFYHVSSSGHINIGESAHEAAVREAREELGIDIDPANLYLVYVVRNERNLRSFLYVYTHELGDDDEFSFDDGEVELVEWHDLEKFCEMTENAAEYKLIDQGRGYFDPLIAAIKRQSQ